jgi:phosphoketolase
MNLARPMSMSVDEPHTMEVYFRAAILSMLARHRAYLDEHLDDMPEIRDWTWAGA